MINYTDNDKFGFSKRITIKKKKTLTIQVKESVVQKLGG